VALRRLARRDRRPRPGRIAIRLGRHPRDRLSEQTIEYRQPSRRSEPFQRRCVDPVDGEDDDPQTGRHDSERRRRAGTRLRRRGDEQRDRAAEREHTKGDRRFRR
jgi:hypothetical protein